MNSSGRFPSIEGLHRLTDSDIGEPVNLGTEMLAASDGNILTSERGKKKKIFLRDLMY